MKSAIVSAEAMLIEYSGKNCLLSCIFSFYLHVPKLVGTHYVFFILNIGEKCEKGKRKREKM
jgi:hypothetical protein